MSVEQLSSFRVHNALFINIAIPAPSSQARKLLPASTGLHLVEMFPGQTLVILAFAHYRDSPAGPCTEATLALMATPERTIPLITLKQLMDTSRYPAYVLHMFVSTAAAQQLGAAQWGLPRQLAAVQVEEQGLNTICAVQLEGQSVLHCEVQRPNTNRTRDGQFETYSLVEGKLQRTVMMCRAQAYGRVQGGGATVRWGSHPVGRRMAGMGIKTHPLMVRYYDQMQIEVRNAAV